ncbi:MAG: substrate-binding domain-containing protein [Opitutae bacterium]|nr:substrate-binding domain-containing protein [Opitutae bacterium]
MLHPRVFGPLLASIALATAGRAAEVRIVGSDLLGPAFAAALEKFGRENGAKIAATLAGTRPGLDQLRAGVADVGLFALPPGETPPAAPFVAHVIACQPVVLIVPDKLPLTQLTAAQVRGIFAATGAENLTLWGELGLTGEWRARTIAIHVVEPAAALTLPLFRRLALSGAELKPLANTAALDRVLDRVRASDNAIGLVATLPAQGSGLRALALAPSVRESAHQPTAANLHDGSYPLRLPLYLVFRREAVPRLLVFLRFLLSDECADALAQADFQPLPPDARNQLVFELEELAQP